MKVAPLITVALILCIACPGFIQTKKKPKPKICIGKNGNEYAVGNGYIDTEGEVCIRYRCVKKKKKVFMKENKCIDGEWSDWSSWSACTATCGNATRTKERTCSNPPPSKGGNQCTGLEEEIQECSLPKCRVIVDLETRVTKLEAMVKMLKADLTTKCDATTCSNIHATTTDIEVNITSNMEAISSNKASIVSNKVDISTNNNGINTNKDTCSAIETTVAKLETCLGDVNSTDCPSSEDGKISVVNAIKGNKDDIEALEKPPKFNLALTGGYTYAGRLATSEIISPGGVCNQSIPPLPVAANGVQPVYFSNTLMVCGGYGGGWIKKCHQLRDSNSEWTEGPAMNTPRHIFSMTKAGQDLYALGGYNGGNLDSMEKLSESSGKWTMMAQKLTSPRRFHCTVFMETTRSLVTNGGLPHTNLVEEFGLATSTWKELAPLPVALFGHGCMVLGHSIVVTGGYSSGGPQKKVYTFAGGQWATTGELQQAKYYHSMGTLDNKVLVLGGYDGGEYFDTIEEMQQDGSFRIMEGKLKEKRAYSAATQVPREKFPC